MLQTKLPYPRACWALALALAFPAASLHAQPASDKKTQSARILKIQQPGIETAGRVMAERPALAMLDQAGAALEAGVPADKREAVGKEIQGDIKKYLDEAVPLVRDRAVKLAPQTIGTVLEEKFTADELKQLANFLESPVYTKYQQLGVDMEKALLEKLLADTRGMIEPKLKTLEASVAKRLGVSPTGK